MKNILKTLSAIAIITTISSVGASAATINSESTKNDPIKVNLNYNIDDLQKNSIGIMSIDGKIVKRLATMNYSGTIDQDGNSYKYSLTIEIPYETYEDNEGKSIYSVDDDNIASYLKNTATFRKYEQDYAYSKINSSGSSATIKGFGTTTLQVQVQGVGVNIQRDVDFSVTIRPTSGN